MRYVLAIIVLYVIPSSFLLAQGDINDEQKALVRNEQTVHIALYSNGWGFGYTYGKMINIYQKHLFFTELSFIKDAKEYKLTNPQQPDLRRFVYGKNNQFYNLKFGYGKLFKLYDKKDRGGIEVRWYWQGGVTLGFLKPVYYVTDINPVKEEKFDNQPHSNQAIYGGAPYFKGFNELSVVPGITAKLGGSFEFSKKDLNINALEGGLSFDVYPKEINIMANEENQFYFIAIFASYRFGKIINPRAVAKNTEPDK